MNVNTKLARWKRCLVVTLGHARLTVTVRGQSGPAVTPTAATNPERAHIQYHSILTNMEERAKLPMVLYRYRSVEAVHVLPMHAQETNARSTVSGSGEHGHVVRSSALAERVVVSTT